MLCQRFQWRGSFGSLRWLILGTLGVSQACGGRTDSTTLPGESGRDSSSGAGGAAQGGAGGSTMAHTAGTAGLSDPGGIAGAGGSIGLGVAGAGGTGMNSQPSACVFEATLDGGMERCSNGLLHRASVGSCPSSIPRPEALVPSPRYPADAGIDYACQSDNDCTDQPHGYCDATWGSPACSYGCALDTDCAANELCLCGSPVGQCVPATCRSDAQCGSGSLCASNEDCYVTRFSCQQPADECAVSSDCAPLESCVYASDENPLAASNASTRVCQLRGCPVIGRPFLVDGAERLAVPVQRADWYAGSSGNSAAAPPVTPELACELAAGWTEQALMEHASVAAFARFALQLLSLGAPAQLLSDTTRAMQDELRHARDCFRLARRRLPADIGPGPLPVHGALAEMSLREIVLTTVREGCIGETVAALEATEALAHCEDAEARAVLERIAVEEGEHAQLAWRFVAWVLETAPHAERPALLASIDAVFAAEIAATGGASAVGERDRELARHGLLSIGVRQALRQRALLEVVAPCARALLAPDAQPLLAPDAQPLLAPARAQSANRSSMPSAAQARRVAGRAAT